MTSPFSAGFSLGFEGRTASALALRAVIIQLTDLFAGDPPLPVWDDATHPPVEKVVSPEALTTVLEGLIGNAYVAIRSASVDVYGQQSAWSDITYTTTAKDDVAPDQPQSLIAIGGFRGAAVTWNAANVPDLLHYELDFGLDPAFATYSTVKTKTTAIWVAGLTPETDVGEGDVVYSFRVRAVDTSGNLSAYSDADTAVATQVGGADIAARSVTTAHVATSGLSADVIKTGTITITPVGGAVNGAVAISVMDSDGVTLLGSWFPDTGITIYSSADQTDYAVLDDGYLRFYQNGILTAELGPEGLLASSIRYGTQPGGMNLVKNGSFEIGPYSASVDGAFEFTDTTYWKAGDGTNGRTTALVNTTEGDTLTPTTVSYA